MSRKKGRTFSVTEGIPMPIHWPSFVEMREIAWPRFVEAPLVNAKNRQIGMDLAVHFHPRSIDSDETLAAYRG